MMHTLNTKSGEKLVLEENDKGLRVFFVKKGGGEDLFLTKQIGDRSKLTGYLGGVLGKICLKISLCPPFFSRKKVFAPKQPYAKS